jgi:predicted MFS family arabinose efflux permease
MAEPERGRAFGALRHRDFRLFWIGSIIAHIGLWMDHIARAWLIYELTGSAFLVGLSGLFASIPFIAMSLYAGTLIDRVDRRKLLIRVEALNLTTAAVIAGLVVTANIEIWHLYVATVLTSLTNAFEIPARSSLLPNLVPRQDLMTALSLHSILRKGSQIVGPALAGALIAAVGVRWTFLIQVFFYSGLFVSICLVRSTNIVDPLSRTNPLRSFAEGLKYVWSDPVIGSLLLLGSTMSIFASINAMMVVFATDVFEAGPVGFGILQSASGIGAVVGSLGLAAAGDIRRKGLALISGCLVFGATMIAFAYCSSFVVGVILLGVVGLADTVLGTMQLTILQVRARGQMLGRVMSLHAISTRGISPLGSFQMGTLTSFVGVQHAVAIGGLLSFLATLGVIAAVPAVRTFTGASRRQSADGEHLAPSSALAHAAPVAEPHG